MRLATSQPNLPAIPSAKGSAIAQSLTRDQVQRTIVFLLDDESFAAGTIPAVREAVKNTIERSIQPGDLAALIRSSSGNGSLEQFTSDKRILLESASKIRWTPESRANPGMLPQLSGAVVGENMGMYRVEDSIMRTKLALRYVISALRDFPGRKAVFLLSQSLPSGTWYANPNTSIATDTGTLVDEALRAGVVIYSVDPTPLSSLTPDASYDVTRDYNAQNPSANFGPAGAGGLTARQVAAQLNGYTSRALDLLEVFRSGLRALAEGTGGQMAADTDATNALAKFTDDLQGYYLLTYRPQQPERYFAAKNGDPALFRNIKVHVARAGLHVRTYAGYVAEPDRVEPETTPHGEISKALFSPFTTQAVHVDLTPIFTLPQPKSPEVNLLLHIDAHDLSFTADEDGRHHATAEIVARAGGERNDAVQVVTKDLVLRLPEASYTQAMRTGISARLSLPPQRSGLYEVRVAVRDSASGKLGSARGFVEVPDLKNGKLALSGVLVYNASQGMADPEAPGLAELRKFRREDNLSYSCQIFNAKSIQAEARLFHDGQQISTSPAEVVSNGDGTSTARGAISLSNLTPGHYFLQVFASPDAGKTAAEAWTDLDIVL